MIREYTVTSRVYQGQITGFVGDRKGQDVSDMRGGGGGGGLETIGKGVGIGQFYFYIR